MTKYPANGEVEADCLHGFVPAVALLRDEEPSFVIQEGESHQCTPKELGLWLSLQFRSRSPCMSDGDSRKRLACRPSWLLL